MVERRLGQREAGKRGEGNGGAERGEAERTARAKGGLAKFEKCVVIGSHGLGDRGARKGGGGVGRRGAQGA
jgi:hypothetical protein